MKKSEGTVKGYRKIIVFFMLLMTAALIVLVSMSKSSTYKKRDIAEYNDKLIGMEEEYLRGVSAEELEKRYGCRIIFSKNFVDGELSAYYRDNALVIDFAPGGEYLGKVVWDDTKSAYNSARKKNLIVMITVWGVITLCGIILIVILYFAMIRPVKELNRFSTEIARGNLDTPIPIRKSSISEGFTESFDLMREELKASREREILADKAKKEMVADLSHDIKTPAATIQATCEVLEMKVRRKLGEEQNGPTAGSSGTDASGEIGSGRSNSAITVSRDELEDVIEKVQSISAKTETINSIMGNVFHASMEELDRLEVAQVEESTELIENYFRSLKDYGTIILDNEIPKCLVYMDRLRMEQVIDNVIGNSHKYAGTDIHVSFDELEGSGKKYIRVRVCDNGPGVDEDDLPLITEKYFRGKAAKNQSGYGIGMHLVKSYMEKMGGGMEYYNDNGFVVELLLKKV